MIRVALAAGWGADNLHDPGHTSWVGSILHTDPAQDILTAGYDLDDLDRVHYARSRPNGAGYATVYDGV